MRLTACVSGRKGEERRREEKKREEEEREGGEGLPSVSVVSVCLLT